MRKQLLLDPFNAFVHKATLSSPLCDGTVLKGWKIGVKDNIAVKGWPLTCASKSLKSYIAPYSADLIENVLDLGAEICGKTNMDEFGMGSRGERSIFGATLNPLDGSKSAGGSSGGSAAAVASGMCRLAFGSDTGGSVRLPASYCGIVGFKPTWGLLSRHGLVSYAPSLDTVGFMTRCVDDAVTCLEGLLAPAQRTKWNNDPTLTEMKENELSAFEPLPLEGLTIGVLQEWIDALSGVSGHVLDRVLNKLDDSGARMKLIRIPELTGTECLDRYYDIACMEASSTLARYIKSFSTRTQGEEYLVEDGDFSLSVRTFQEENFGSEVFRRIQLGRSLLMHPEGAHLKQSQEYRNSLRRSFDRAFNVECCDVIIGPTAFSTAPSTDLKLEEEKQDDLFTVPSSLAGLPSVSLPLHPIRVGTERVIGTQLIAARLDDRLLLRVAREIEQLFK